MSYGVSSYVCACSSGLFFFQAEDGIRDLVRSRGLGDVYKRQYQTIVADIKKFSAGGKTAVVSTINGDSNVPFYKDCLLYTSDAADERSSVDLGGRRIIKKKKSNHRQSRAMKFEIL